MEEEPITVWVIYVCVYFCIYMQDEFPNLKVIIQWVAHTCKDKYSKYKLQYYMFMCELLEKIENEAPNSVKLKVDNWFHRCTYMEPCIQDRKINILLHIW